MLLLVGGGIPAITLSQPNYSYGCFDVGVVVVVEAALEDIQVSSLEFLLSLTLSIFANQRLIELKVKRDLFARIDAAAPPCTILASNTSR